MAFYPVEQILGLYPNDTETGIQRIQALLKPDDIRSFIRSAAPDIQLSNSETLAELIEVLLERPFYELVDKPDGSGKEQHRTAPVRVIRALIFHAQAFHPDPIHRIAAVYGDPEIPIEATKDALRTMLKHIPPDKQRRVLDRIRMEADKYGYEISNRRWWDILPGWRCLCYDVKRDDTVIPVRMLWKRTSPGISPILSRSSDWVPDTNSPVGFALELEYDTYQHLRTAIQEWFAGPLQIPKHPLRQSA